MKRILSLTVIFIMLLGTTQAFAFTDVYSDDWYNKTVTALSNEGTIKGYSDGTFKPNNNMTYAEFLSILYKVKNETLEPVEEGTEWFSSIYSKAVDTELISSSQDMNESISRLSVANIVVKSYGLTKSNILVNFQDTSDDAAVILYQKGIMKGNYENNKLYFYPNKNITRAEIAKIYCSLFKMNGNDIAGIGNGSIHEVSYNYIPYETPRTVNEWMSTYGYYILNEEPEFDIVYPNDLYNQMTINDQGMNKMRTDALKLIREDCPEYTTGFIKAVCKYSTYGNGYTYLHITLTNKEDETTEICDRNIKFVERCKNLISTAYANGVINDTITDYEKARILHNHIINHTVYDFGLNSISYSGYGAVYNGYAVCQGYSAYYAYLCKLAGVNCKGVLGGLKAPENHMWNSTLVDGTWYFNDVTNDDRDNPNYDRFCKDATSFRNMQYLWDENTYNLVQ